MALADAFRAGAFLAGDLFAAAFLRGAGAVGTGPADHSATHSSMTDQVVPRAARPVSMPRCPPGTISKRTCREPVSIGTTARTAARGAMPSVLPANTSVGTRIPDS